MRIIEKPNQNEYGAYFQPYMDLVNEPALEAMAKALKELEDFHKLIDESKSTYRYAEGKWSVNEVLLHLVDCERIFNYRALSFSRGELEVPGFDHDLYVTHSHADERTVADIFAEYAKVRAASLALFASFNEQHLNTMGKANGNPISVRALGFLITGHQRHHLNVIKERYL